MFDYRGALSYIIGESTQKNCIFARNKEAVMIVGRKKEIKILNDNYNSSDSSFIAVYGRRRIGKTYLINKNF